MREQGLSKVSRICFTYIPVTDIRRAAAWYAKVLGFQPDLVFESHVILQPDLQLLLADGPITPDTLEGKPLPRAAFFCDTIHEFHTSLKEQGVQIEELVDEGECGWHFELYDPDGNRITIWQAAEV